MFQFSFLQFSGKELEEEVTVWLPVLKLLGLM